MEAHKYYVTFIVDKIMAYTYCLELWLLSLQIGEKEIVRLGKEKEWPHFLKETSTNISAFNLMHV